MSTIETALSELRYRRDVISDAIEVLEHMLDAYATPRTSREHRKNSDSATQKALVVLEKRFKMRS